MAGIRFTGEQFSLLRSNPWVKSATPSTSENIMKLINESLGPKGQNNLSGLF